MASLSDTYQLGLWMTGLLALGGLLWTMRKRRDRDVGGQHRARIVLACVLGTCVLAQAMDLVVGQELHIASRLHAPAYREALVRSTEGTSATTAELADQVGIIEPGGSVRVWFARASRVHENGHARVLFVDRAAGERPLLARTVFAIACLGNLLLLAGAAWMMLAPARQRSRGEGGWDG